MRNMQTIRGSFGVLALLFAASFLLLLPGCQAPAGPQADRTGTVSLTIGQLDMGRAIQPGTLLTDFTGFTAVFARANHDDVTVNFATGATTAQAELPQGPWNLTVNAFIGAVVVATYGPTAITVEPGFNGVTAILAPIATDGLGTFSWALAVPDGTTSILEIRTVGPDGNIVMAPILDSADFDGYPDPELWDGELELAAGTYFVRFVLTHDDYGVAFLNSDLHVYKGMESSIARTFTSALFRDAGEDTDIENVAVTVTAPVAGATPVMTATVGTSVSYATGPVTWYPAHSPFQGETAYTATVTLTANPGYVFADTLTTATINGQVASVASNTGTTVTLAHAFAPTGPLLAAWQFGTVDGTATANNQAVSANIESGNASRPSSGLQAADARLRFWVSPGGVVSQRALNASGSGVNVRNAADAANGGLDGAALAGNAWWETAISTTGRTDIAVTWRMRSPATGPRDWRLQYRAGSAGDWNNVGGTIALPSGLPASTLEAPVQRRFLPSSAENHERLYLRWLMTSNLAPNGNPIASGGTHQINDLVIRADSEPFENDYDCEHCNDEGCAECDETSQPTIISIAAANQIQSAAIASAQVVTVEGFVVGQGMQLNGEVVDNANVFVQDGTGPSDGILVWGATGAGSVNLAGYVGEWVRVTGHVTPAGGSGSPWNQIQVGGTGATAGSVEIITPGTTPFEPQTVQLSNLTTQNRDNYLFMRVSLGPVRFGHNNDRSSFLTAPGVNTTGAPPRSHFVIMEGGHRVELRPPVGVGASTLDGFVTNDYIMIEHAYVAWQNGRSVIQLLHAVVVRAEAP